jgi:hypothetical protein
MVKLTVEIGGEERPVMFGLHAIREVEKTTGYRALDAKTASNLGTLEAVQWVCYCGLKWGLYKGDGQEPRPKFSAILVGDWVQECGLQAGSAVDKIMQAFLDSLPSIVKNGQAAQSSAANQ